ncbi:hypothetical protein [Nitrosovibrio sp. Nv17]|uniref:hypothetical protein n=1 Tax=Nitrosovibrio sp. Nv17 TaxID=1855339 RepID=UPI000AF17B97|nr:hypothetical protein [Nitrosovibrio sp. Nv17]
MLRAYREFEERIGTTIERGRGSKDDRVCAEVLGCTLPFSILEIEESCPGVSRDMDDAVGAAGDETRGFD